MNPFYFGTSEKPLFGVYHPPAGRSFLGRGVVLCYPMGWEYMRAHRAFRQLAMLLSKAGFHVLRFDYFGTGDSAGAGEEATLAQWVEDVGAAVDELKDTAGIRRVSLVGLRLGGSLAALAAEGRGDLETLVLWDPVVSGAAYLEELLTSEFLGAGGRARGAAGPIGVGGFPLGEGLRGELAGLDLMALSRVPARTLLVVSRESEGYGALAERLRGVAAAADYRCIPSPGNWAEGDKFGSALLPQQIIQGIVASLLTGDRVA